MTGRIVFLSGNRHRCLPDSWRQGGLFRTPDAAHAPMGSVWQCDCGRTWKRAPRPFERGQRPSAPCWRRERRGEKIIRKWRGR